ncbi:MAG: hypothetical protein ABW065_05795 [Solirubrobacterales bacterium]
MTPGLRRLYAPRSIEVELGADGVPTAVEGVAVEVVRERWAVDDRWWERTPLRRRYFELALSGGRSLVVFRDLVSGRWYRQRA